MRLLAILSVLVLLASCEAKFDWPWNKGGSSAHPTGQTVTQDRTVGSFDQVKLDGLGRLVFDGSIPVGTVRVKADQGLMQAIQVVVEGSQLQLKETGIQGPGSWDLEFRVAPPANLSGVTLSGLGSIEAEAPLKTSSVLGLNLDGLGQISLEVDAPGVTAHQQGSGQLKVTGTAAQVDVVANGLGQVDVSGLKAKNVTVDSNGLGEVTVFASSSLKVRANGLGAVHFQGHPATTYVQTKGMTQVTAID